MHNPFTSNHRRLVFETSRYQRVLHDLRADSGSLAEARDTMIGALTDAGQGANSRDDVGDISGEIFARLFNDPGRLDTPSDEVPIAPPAHDALSELPEWESLRQSVQGDADFSALATASVLRELAARVPDLLDAADDDSDGSPGSGSNSGADAGDRLRAAMRGAIKVAAARVHEGKEALNGLMPGLGDAPLSHQQEDPRRFALAERLIDDPVARDVLRKAGRITRLASRGKKTRDLHARSEVYGIEQGSDIGRILPAAAVGLVDEDLEDLALLDIIEGKALQYKLRGTDVLGRGPIVALIDRSASMYGSPERWASAMAIAVVSQGVKENRPVTIVEFQTSVSRVHHVDAKGQATERDVHDPQRVVRTLDNAAAVTLALATADSPGGTEFDRALSYALRAGALDPRADLLFVTDGRAERVSGDVVRALEEARAERGLRVYALTVNGGSVQPSIEQIADAAVDLDRVPDVGAAIAAAMPDDEVRDA